MKEQVVLRLYLALVAIVGFNEAIILNQLHERLKTNGIKIEGHDWYCQTYKEWQQQFPFWSIRTIQRTFRSLEMQGVIESSTRFNRFPIDRRKWYRICYDKIPFPFFG